MTDADREMLTDVYWTLIIVKGVIGFYIGYRIAEWVKKLT